MNYQSSQPTSQNRDSQDVAVELQAVESANRRLQRNVLVWMGAAVVGFVVSEMMADPNASLLSQGAVVCSAMGLIYAGRWLQGTKTLAWLRSKNESRPEIDWSEIPESGGVSEMRLFASIEEAVKRGWVAGPVVAMFGGTAVPEWMECDGKRYAFDGLMGSSGSGFVPENLRVFGRLRFLAAKAPDAPPVSATPETSQDPGLNPA